MEPTNWLKQTKDSPLYEDVLWLKPENIKQKPRVLVVGGSSHGFVYTMRMYESIKSKSAHQTKLIMPQSLEKILGKSLSDAIYVNSTGTGEIAHVAKNDLLSAITWSDFVIFCDDLGNNSQTEILISELVATFDKPTIFAGRAIDLLLKNTASTANNPKIVLVGDIAQIQKFSTANLSQFAIKQSDGLVVLANKFAGLSASTSAAYVTSINDRIVTATDGKVTVSQKAEAEWSINYIAALAQFGKMYLSQKNEILATAAYLCLI